MKQSALTFFVLLMILLSSCAVDRAENIGGTATIEPAVIPTSEPAQPPTSTVEATPELSLEESADRVINAMGQKDLKTVAEFVHPIMGVRFSPYGFIRAEHQVFMPEALSGLAGSDSVFLWGQYDGTGDPIRLTFNDYYKEFVYSSDFANAEAVAVNERLGDGNTLNNIQEFYPGSSFVEYHFSGFDPQYGGMDWQSLRLIFVQESDGWFLIGIVHDEWTI